LIATKTASWPHQDAAQAFLDDHPNAMLAAAMGTGKSKIIVDRICSYALDNPRINVLILCPKAAMRVWPREFRKHGIIDLPVVVLDNVDTGRKAQAVRYLDAGVFVVNYESAWRSPLAEELCSRKWDFVICDESHKIKTQDSKASRFVTYLSAEHKYCLTGTPTPNGPLDAYGQFRFLDSSVFGASWLSFKHHFTNTYKRRMWTRKGWIEFEDIADYKNMAHWQELFSSMAYRINNDVLNLPDPILTPIEIDLSPDTRRMYDKLAKTLTLQLEAGEVTPQNAGVLLLRLQQMTSGRATTDDGRVVEVGHEKADAIEELIEDLNGEKVAVFCRFRADLEQVEAIAAKQGKSYGEISGSRKDGLNSDACWADDKQVLGVQIQAGGTGIDLTAGHYAIYWSVGYSYSDYVQSVARLARPGQKHTVMVYHVIARNTADEKVWQSIEEKREFSDALLEALKA
jgi:SNF2 family DNA or RNA helicase